MSDLSVKTKLRMLAKGFSVSGDVYEADYCTSLAIQLESEEESLWDALARKEVQAEKVVPLEKQLERMIEVAEELNYRLAKTKQPEGFYGDIERSKELLGEHNATN